MSEVTVSYNEYGGDDGETIIKTTEKRYFGEYLPRIGEKIFVEGEYRTVVDVKHYPTSGVLIDAMQPRDYEFASEEVTDKMMEAGVDQSGLSERES